jgi:aarF domain-containing kinase
LPCATWEREYPTYCVADSRCSIVLFSIMTFCFLLHFCSADEEVDTKKFGKDIERMMERMTQFQPEVVASVMDGGVQGSIAFDETEITDLVLELVEVTENNGLKLPREFGLLVKQALYFDRYIKILAPNVDVMSDSRVMIGGKDRSEAKEVNGEKPAFIDV